MPAHRYYGRKYGVAKFFRRPGYRSYPYRGRTHHLYSFGAFAPLRNGGFGGPIPHQPELKAIDHDFQMNLPVTALGTTHDVVTAWAIQYLNGVVQGTTLYTRIGQKIVMQKLLLKMVVQNVHVASAVSNEGFVRVMIVYDAQCNGTPLSAAAAATALLKNPDEITSVSNLDNRERFRVLMDKTWYIGTSGLDASIKQNGIPVDRAGLPYKRFKQNLKLDTIFNAGNAGTAGDIESGSLFILAGTDKFGTTSTGFIATLSANSRIRFYDA